MTTVQVVSIKDALKIVPEFDGKNIPLSQFLEGCTEALAMLEDNAEPSLAKFLRPKISGEARQAITGQTFATVEELKNFLKKIYAPAKSVTQLLGDLGKEFQDNEESVITFANRLKILGSRITEAKKLEAGTLPATFTASLENSMVECFKAGLKPEIEQRIGAVATVNDIVKQAIKKEKLLVSRKALRRSKNNTEIAARKKTFHCQLCRQSGHEATNCGILNINKVLTCTVCNRSGHKSESCNLLDNKPQKIDVPCTMCQRIGYSCAVKIGNHLSIM